MVVDLQAGEISRRPSVAGAVAVAVCWAAFAFGAVLLPLRLVFIGAIVSAPFFGEYPDASERAESATYYLSAAETSLVATAVVLILALGSPSYIVD